MTGITDEYTELAESIRGGAYRASHDKLPVLVALPPHIALLVADAIDAHVKRLFAQVNISPVAEVADEVMQDITTRALLAINDLELLLETFIGRPAATMEQVREHRTKIAMSSVEPRRGRAFPASDELKKSIRTGRIGDARDPGQEG